MSFFISITKPKKIFSIEEHLKIFKFIPLKKNLFRVCIQCTLEFVFAQWYVREERREKHKQVEVFIGWIACEFFSKYFVLFWIFGPKKLSHQLINMSALFRSSSCTQLEGLLFTSSPKFDNSWFKNGQYSFPFSFFKFELKRNF